MSNDDLFRSFTPEIEASTDGRTLRGIAVPYGVKQRIDNQLVEVFARGAFNKVINAAHRIPLAREHMGLGGSLIGRVTLLRDDAAGLYFEARVSDTALGNETLALLNDGALDQVSIAFRAGQDRRLSDGSTERVTAELRELAVVLNGAYGDSAVVSSVRSTSNLTIAQNILSNLRIL